MNLAIALRGATKLMGNLYRFIFALGTIFSFLALSFFRELAFSITYTPENKRISARLTTMSAFANFLLKHLHFNLTAQGQIDSLVLLKQRGGLLVANHVSFWDMLILAAFVPMRFITSIEVKNTPLLGQIARGCGALFIERRNKDKIEQEIAEVSSVIQKGGIVCLFPEGTTGDGTRLLPFKSSFFRAALIAEKPVLPMCLNYTHVDDEPLNTSNREKIFYFGDHSFLRQLWRTCSTRKIDVGLHINLVATSTIEYTTPRQMADHCFSLIQGQHHPVLPIDDCSLHSEVSAPYQRSAEILACVRAGLYMG